MDIQQAQQEVVAALQDVGLENRSRLLGYDDLVAALGRAARHYSAARPRVVVSDLPVSDGRIALPAGWEEGLSEVVAIEAPPDQKPPAFVDRRYWWFRWLASGSKVIELAPGVVATTARVAWTASRNWGATEAETTILPIDEEAVIALAVSYCCLVVAARMARSVDPTIQADAFQYRSRSDEWRSLAAEWRKRYEDHMAAVVPPASHVINLDVAASTGEDYLTHPRWSR